MHAAARASSFTMRWMRSTSIVSEKPEKLEFPTETGGGDPEDDAFYPRPGGGGERAQFVERGSFWHGRRDAAAVSDPDTADR